MRSSAWGGALCALVLATLAVTAQGTSLRPYPPPCAPPSSPCTAGLGVSERGRWCFKGGYGAAPSTPHPVSPAIFNPTHMSTMARACAPPLQAPPQQRAPPHMAKRRPTPFFAGRLPPSTRSCTPARQPWHVLARHSSRRRPNTARRPTHQPFLLPLPRPVAHTRIFTTPPSTPAKGPPLTQGRTGCQRSWSVPADRSTRVAREPRLVSAKHPHISQPHVPPPAHLGRGPECGAGVPGHSQNFSRDGRKGDMHAREMLARAAERIPHRRDPSWPAVCTPTPVLLRRLEPSRCADSLFTVLPAVAVRF